MHWNNIEAEFPESYYCKNLTIPFLDYLNQELEHRFSTNARIASLGLCLVPDVMQQVDDW